VAFDVTLEASQVVEPTTSTATGVGYVEVDTINNILSYEIVYTDLSSSETMAHIHGFAPRGVNAPALHALPLGSPKNGTWDYDESDEEEILAGLTYVLIHSEDFPDGEIRGQIDNGYPCPTPTPTPTETPTPTPTDTPTPTPTDTPTPVPTETPTPTPTETPVETPTPTDTPTPVPTETPTPTPTPFIHYTFDPDPQGWIYQGLVMPFTTPVSDTSGGRLWMSPEGSTYGFSYWYSPDEEISGSHLYRGTWTVGSTAETPDESVRFRLRVNQKGAWAAWIRDVNSLMSEAPSASNPKDYMLYFDPEVKSASDGLLVFSFDCASFEPSDDATSWIYIDELLVEEVMVDSATELLRYDFTTDSEGWSYKGSVPPFDEPLSGYEPGRLGLNPNGSTSSFSYWESPDLLLEDGKLYRIWFELSSSVTDPNLAVSSRMRINQKGRWGAWMRRMESNFGHGPSDTQSQTYGVICDPTVTGVDDSLSQLSFDILSFYDFDDTASWLYLDSVSFEEITLAP